MKNTFDDCNRLYEILVARLRADVKTLPPSEAVRQIEGIALFATLYAPGLLADARLDAMLIQLSARELPSIKLQRSPEGRRRLLHVLTEVWHVGGHTRVLNNWIKLDRAAEHVVVITKQNSDLPGWLESSLRQAGVPVHIIAPRLPSLERARRLREFAAGERWSAIVLHHHGDDAVPILAFAEAGDVPVLIYNHADFLFWLGASVADLVIDFSPIRMEQSRTFRQARWSYLMPLPLGDALPHTPPKEFRHALGLAESEVMLVSMGRRLKFRPFGEYDFFATMAKVLSDCPQAHLYVIGVSEEDYLQFAAVPCPANLHCVGELSDPVNYCAAADLFVEPFPIGTALGVLDVCRFGAVPVFAFGHLPMVYGEGSIDLFGGSEVETRLRTEEEYRAYLVNLIRDSRERRALGEKVRRFITQRCTGPAWLEELDRMYWQIDKCRHRVAVASGGRRGTDRHFREFHMFSCGDFMPPVVHMINVISRASCLKEWFQVNWWFFRWLPGAVWTRRSFRGLGFRALLRFNARTLRVG